MSNKHEHASDITFELEMISKKRFDSFGTLPRSLSTVEKAAEEIKRLRRENALLSEEIKALKSREQ